MSTAIFKIAVGFVLAVLITLAGSLYLSNRYLGEQQRLAASGDVEGALDAARLAARLDPWNSTPLAAEAYLLQRQGRLEEAVEVLRSAIERDPANYGNLVQLGNLQLNQLNDPEAAVGSYRRAVEKIPRDTSLITSYAQALTRTGDLEGAKREYEKAMELGKVSTRNLYNLGKIYTRTGEPEKAVAVLELARRAVSANLEESEGQRRAQMELFIDSVDLAIADAYVVQGDYEGAMRVLEGSDAEQAPAILELLKTNPEGYRESVLNSGL